MTNITISSSLRFKENIKTAITEFTKLGITAYFPNLDLEVKKDDITLELMQRLERDHFASIKNTEALYIICPGGYVGVMVSAEIGFARALGKPVIFSETPTDLGIQSLATGYVALTDLNKFLNL
jgi:hypothetical protein